MAGVVISVINGILLSASGIWVILSEMYIFIDNFSEVFLEIVVN